MYQHSIDHAIRQILAGKLSISLYGKEKCFTPEDVYDYVLFDAKLGQQLADLCIKSIGNSDELKYEWDEFWDDAVNSFVLTSDEIKAYYHEMELNLKPNPNITYSRSGEEV